jgi:Family of unknown function (DUF5683)
MRLRLLILFILGVHSLTAQPQLDTSTVQQPNPIQPKKSEKVFSPKKAALWGLIPSGGQIYNRRYWKVPIVLGGMAGLGYWWVNSRNQYKCYRQAYLDKVDTDPTTNYVCPQAPLASADQLLSYRDAYRTQSEYALLVSLLFYGLTIGEAFTDAHLRSFDISNDLSLRVSPSFYQNVPVICFRFNFR